MRTGTPSHSSYVVKSAFYMVPSSKPGAAYRVTVDPADGSIVACECKDHQYRRRACRHMRIAGQADHGGLKLHMRVAVHTREAAAGDSAAPAVTVTPPARPRVPYEKVAELYA